MINLEFEDDYGKWVSGYHFPSIRELNKLGGGSENGYLEITIDNFREVPVSVNQLATLYYFNKHQDLIIQGLYRGAFEMREELEDQYGYAREKGANDSFPILNQPHDLGYAITIDTIHVLDAVKDGFHYFALTGECSWDPEHGFGVIMHKDRLIDFGSWDLSSGGTIKISRDNDTVTSAEIANEKEWADRTAHYQQKLASGKTTFPTNDPILNSRYSYLFDWLASHRVISGYRYAYAQTPILDKIKVLENLFSLDLSYRDIETLHPDINLLQNLKQLWISSIKISIIPTTICELKKLEIFSATRCNLTELQAAFSQLIKLNTLALGSNNISVFPEEIKAFTQLSRLSLDRNKIETIPDWLSNLQELESLDLEDNQIAKVPKSILTLQKLQDFRIRDNQISERRKEKLLEQLATIPRFYC